MTQAHDKILIVDFGSQVTQLIARRVREEGVYSEIVPFNAATEAFYGGCLELPVAATWSDTSALWSGRRFTYLAFALPGGALLDFFAIDDINVEAPVAAVPEPGTLTLLSLGTAYLIRRRRRNGR